MVIANNESAAGIFGLRDENLRLIESEFGVRILSRGNEITISGASSDVDRVESLILELQELARGRKFLTQQEVKYAIKLMTDNERVSFSEISKEVIQVTARGKQIRPKTLGQKHYVDAVRNNGITIAIGPAGTGKTYLAMTMAVAALREHKVNRLVLTRPAVEAGESLGFLPGDLQDKVDPYLRPLYDALYDILGVEQFQKYMEKRIIEVAPLAYMRGRTLDDSFIILDEAQNTTPEQMKMFLTRMGFGSKAIITGDITQVDLPPGKFSGLVQIQSILAGIPGIEFVYLSDRDVVRHELVQRIIKAYEKYEASRGAVAESV